MSQEYRESNVQGRWEGFSEEVVLELDIKTWAGFCGADRGGLERLVVDRQGAGHSTGDNVRERSGFGVVSEVL